MKKLLALTAVAIILFAMFYLVTQYFQDKLIVKNHSTQTISQLTVIFHNDGGKHKRVTFQDVPSQGEQWQQFSPMWGTTDSIRVVSVDGITTDGQKISAKPQSIQYWIPIGRGERFFVIVQADGSAKLDCCN